MKCPTCGSENFYVKDVDDEYEIYEFTCSEQGIEFSANINKENVHKIKNETITFCKKCAWHGDFSKLK